MKKIFLFLVLPVTIILSSYKLLHKLFDEFVGYSTKEFK